MASRRFFFDDCRSPTRLAREYTKVAGADDISVEYQSDIKKFAYSITRAGISNTHYWFIKSTITSDGFEAQYLFKKNSAIATTYGNFGLLFDCIDVNNMCDITKSDMLYFGRRINGAYYYKYWGLNVLNDVWYAMKIRKSHKDVRAKLWLLGTSEPDWQYTQSTTPTGANENPVDYKNRGGNYGITCYLPNVGDWAKIADLCITPVRRAGWP